MTLLIVLFVISLGVKPRRVEDFYKVICYVMGMYQFYITYLLFKFIAESDGGTIAILSIVSCIGTFALIVILNCEILTILKGALHYVFMVPSYVNIFLIYSICNIHDCTWGNRPDALSSDEKERLEEFEEFRTRWAILWLLSNCLLVYLILGVSDTENTDSQSFYFLISIAGVGLTVLLIRVFGGIIFLFLEPCKKTKKEKYAIKENKLALNRGTTHIQFYKTT